MTIVEKVAKLLKKHKKLKLNQICTEIPEHSPAAIRGNMYRHIKRDDREFYRSGKSEYSIVEQNDVVDIDTNTNNVADNKGKVLSFSEIKAKKTKSINTQYKVYNQVAGLNNSELEVIESSFDYSSNISSTFNRSINILKEGFNSISSMFNRVMHMDAVKFLKMIPDNFIDLVVTDPPYPVISGGRSNKKGTPSGMLKKNDGKIFTHNNLPFEDWVPELYRVMKEGSQAYIMTNFLNLNKLMNLCEKVGFKIHNLLVWKKNNATPNRWYMKNCEYTLFLRKGRAKSILDAGSQTVHEFKNILGSKLHETEKPIELADYYIKNSCVPGGVFLELFAGAGAFAVSALLNGMNVLACEIDKAYQKISDMRMQNAIRLGYDDRDLLFNL